MTTSAATINATDQVRQDFQYSASVDGLLKQVYIPALNNVTFHATPLMDMFGEFGGTIDFAGNKVIKGFKHQGAGGFGGIPEGGTFVTGRKQKGFQGAERLKYLNAFLSLTGPAARTVREGQGAFVDAISSAMDDTLKLAKMQMERIIGGACDGVIASSLVPAATWAGGATTAMTITGLAGTGGYSPLHWLQEGMKVDICSDKIGTLVTGTGKAATVSAIDYAAGTATLTPAGEITVADASTIYLTLASAYGDIEAPGTVTADSCLEPNGLDNLVSDGASAGETDTPKTTIWGLTRSTYPDALRSIVKLAASAELDEELMMGWLLDLVNYRQSVPNVMVTDPRSRLKYFSNLKDDRRFNTTVLDSSFGFRSLAVTIDQYTMLLQSLTSLKPGTLYMLNTGDFKFARATPGFTWIESGGKIMRDYETVDAMFATAVDYVNFVCENPRGQLKATGISYT